MNEIIETIIKQHVAAIGSERLSFVKFNTAGSPMRSNPKVLFFCFVGNESMPRYCLKTVRSSRDNAVVENGFKNMQALSRIDAALFPQPIWCGEFDGIAYSIETVLPGERVHAAALERIVTAYIKFQSAAKSQSIKKDGAACARELLAALNRSDHDRQALEALVKEIGTMPEIMLLPQHGDLTQDNVLVSSSAVGVVDCDWYMPQGIAGFDLFHLLKRTKDSNTARYLRMYREAIGMERAFTEADLLLWHLQEIELKQRQGAPAPKERAAESFAKLRAAFPLA